MYCEPAEFVEGRSAAVTTVEVEGRLAISVAAVEGVAESAAPSTLTLVRPESELSATPVSPTGRGHQIIAGGIDQIAGSVGHERAVAGQKDVAAGAVGR